MDWLDFLKERWPDAPLVKDYRILVFTNEDHHTLKQRYEGFDEKWFLSDQEIEAVGLEDIEPYICSIRQTKEILDRFLTPSVLNNIE